MPGIGLYDLSSEEAQKTGEWQGGIGRLLDAELDAEAARCSRPISMRCGRSNPEGGLKKYPGSPLIVRHLLRKQDRLSAIELHPRGCGAAATALFAGDFQTRVIELDGWLALGAHLPPKEKRGLVLVDPPFEQEGEFERLVDGLARAHRRWPGGIYALWYPIKDRAAVAAFRAGAGGSRASRRSSTSPSRSCRPPSSSPASTAAAWSWSTRPSCWRANCASLLPALHRLLWWKRRARWSLEWLAGERRRVVTLDRGPSSPHSARPHRKRRT